MKWFESNEDLVETKNKIIGRGNELLFKYEGFNYGGEIFQVIESSAKSDIQDEIHSYFDIAGNFIDVFVLNPLLYEKDGFDLWEDTKYSIYVDGTIKLNFKEMRYLGEGFCRFDIFGDVQFDPETKKLQIFHEKDLGTKPFQTGERIRLFFGGDDELIFYIQDSVINIEHIGGELPWSIGSTFEKSEIAFGDNHLNIQFTDGFELIEKFLEESDIWQEDGGGDLNDATCSFWVFNSFSNEGHFDFSKYHV